MEQKLVRWEPIPNLAKGYVTKAVSQKYAKLLILLSSDDRDDSKVLVTFNSSVQAYSVTDEGILLKYEGPIEWPNGAILAERWTFYEVINSIYMKTLAYHLPTWKHYSFRTGSSVIDVVTDQDPIIEHINSLKIRGA